VAVLVVVASGWRPRWTALPHWYVAHSFFSSGVLVDGGDQIAAILSMLLVPIALTDSRRWHWDRAEQISSPGTADIAKRLVALSCVTMIRLQVAGIYFHASVAKMSEQEWMNGTAVYYWFTDPMFGLAEPFRTWALPILASGFVVVLTWGPMILELFLFAGLIASRAAKRRLLVLGILFHAGIAAVHGLLSFALPMWGALILFLRPVDEEFPRLRRRPRESAPSSRSGVITVAGAPREEVPRSLAPVA
jgi:antimicrobial peptide system SdpB family protein